MEEDQRRVAPQSVSALITVRYDEAVDAAYIELSSKLPEGGVEVGEGVVLHVTKDDEIVAIEILDASKRFPIESLFTLKAAS